MSLTKLIPGGCGDVKIAELVKVPSRGLVGHDLSQFIKRASAKFISTPHLFKFASGEIPLHVIAMGCTERFGQNRNGDIWPREMLQRCHPTFVKHARFFRGHQNRDKAKSYGIVKASAYNDEMDRVELLIALNGTKEAAERNGGLVADEELEKLAAGQDLAVSMAGKVGFDLCNGCGNKARTRAEYCGPARCKYGGLRDNIGKTFDDGHVLGAINPDTDFFDISHVFRPADRIAYALGSPEEFSKAASATHSRGGAAAAEEAGVTMPLWARLDIAIDDPLYGPLEDLDKLAGLEGQPRDAALSLGMQLDTNDDELFPDVDEQTKIAQTLAATAQQGILLPLVPFLRLTAGRRWEKAAAAAPAVRGLLPGAFSRLADRDTIDTFLQSHGYDCRAPFSLSAKYWAEKRAADWSLRPQVVRDRVYRATLHGLRPQPIELAKTGSLLAPALADEYATYQLAFLAIQPAGDRDWMRRAIVHYNSGT